MNFVIFPMFFMSSALYPLWRMRESSEWLYWVCSLNPFTYAVELVRFALYQQLNTQALVITLLTTGGFGLLAIWGFKPEKVITSTSSSQP
ncbi:ABC transporter permease [Nitrincola sp. A-D6]|uniref:ABC transporter permease n=1 Tax=Nitrincola sp. A-D6 TaxID=1545442 RepID=UPI001F467BDF